MKAHEIAQIFDQFVRLMTEFIDGNCNQQTFCERAEPLVTALKTNGNMGILAILRAYPTVKEKLRGLTFTALHDIVNRLTGIPSGGIGAIVEQDTRSVWGFAVISPQRAKTIPNLQKRLKSAQRFHLLIERFVT